MRKVTRRRGIFHLPEDEPETEEEWIDVLTRWNDPEDSVRAFLDSIDALCKKKRTKRAKLEPGSEEMLRQMSPLARNVRHKLEQGRDPWSIAFHAISLARLHRDFEANESLMQPLTYASETLKQRAAARATANANRESEADERILKKFADWQSRLAEALRDKPSAADRVKRFIRTNRSLKDREKRRIKSLLERAKIPPLT